MIVSAAQDTPALMDLHVLSALQAHLKLTMVRLSARAAHLMLTPRRELVPPTKKPVLAMLGMRGMQQQAAPVLPVQPGITKSR
jgi:hypothetical protein